jgi:hypothetical protein
MSETGKPKVCDNGCGAITYFEYHSSVGYPTADKWIPLEYNNYLETDEMHECSKPKGVLSNGNKIAAAAIKIKIDDLAVIKQIAEALNEYVAIKEGKVH